MLSPDALKLPISNQCCLPGPHDDALYQFQTVLPEDKLQAVPVHKYCPKFVSTAYINPLVTMPEDRKEKTTPFGVTSREATTRRDLVGCAAGDT